MAFCDRTGHEQWEYVDMLLMPSCVVSHFHRVTSVAQPWTVLAIVPLASQLAYEAFHLMKTYDKEQQQSSESTEILRVKRRVWTQHGTQIKRRASRGTVRTCEALFGLVRPCAALYGLVRPCTALCGLVRHARGNVDILLRMHYGVFS
ncbi:unnamed protein product [Euphydryas editha]|uniref:Uncharacterized protein n=1 Tax=Euphydryas editha TaxID=104508 RepID=A0AAU9TWM4_EUPED|nr:unnamed protein product [Euphydryas editha]